MEEIARGGVEGEVFGGGDHQGVQVGIEQEGGVVGEASHAIEPHGEVDGGVGQGVHEGDRARTQCGEATLAFVSDGVFVSAAARDGNKGLEGMSEVDSCGWVEVDGSGLGRGLADGAGVDGRGGPREGRGELEKEYEGVEACTTKRLPGGRHGRMESRAPWDVHGDS